MDYLAVGLIGFCLGVLLTALMAGVSREVGRMRSEGGELRAQVEELGRKIEEQERRRHSHRTIAGLEDATAVLIDAEIEAEALAARLRTAHRIIGKTREGPEAYSNSEFGTTDTQSSQRKKREEK